MIVYDKINILFSSILSHMYIICIYKEFISPIHFTTVCPARFPNQLTKEKGCGWEAGITYGCKAKI